MCGEKARQGSGLNLRLGSPPRVRGKVRGFNGGQFEEGITPACAGKRYIIGIDNGHIYLNSRICGEKSELIKFLT